MSKDPKLSRDYPKETAYYPSSWQKKRRKLGEIFLRRNEVLDY